MNHPQTNPSQSHTPAARSASSATGTRTHALVLHWPRILLMLFTVVALSLLMSVQWTPDRVALSVGDVSQREILANRSVLYPSPYETELLRDNAQMAVKPVYDEELGAQASAFRMVTDLFDRLDRERSRRKLLANPQRVEIAVGELNALRDLLGTSGLRFVLGASPALFQKMRAVTLKVVADEMDREIRNTTDDLADALSTASSAARRSLANEDAARLVTTVAGHALRPNRVLNPEKTQQARTEASRQVRPVSKRILLGERVIGAGETVTPAHLEKLTALGLLNPRLSLATGLAVCLLAVAMVALTAVYIKRTLPALFADTRKLALLVTIALLSMSGLKFGASMLGVSFSSGQIGYLGMMSVAAAGMLVAVLLDTRLAVVIVALLSVQSGLLMNYELRYTVMTLMSSLVGIVSVGGANARNRHNLVETTLALAGANLVLVWLIGLLTGDAPAELMTASAWAVGSAAFAAFLFWFGLLALERPFGILTHQTLLEMSAFDRPLLRQLCAVAPGTYAHSMMVGTLAESGAQAIGADALLCRVGGYYHDIGKMKRPDFFVENQRGVNAHGRLSPSLSALIITGHVRDGLEMAQEYRLPCEIKEIIAQHHGTTLITYFYHQALADVTDGELPAGFEERFRYPGPKPQSREAAIVMLADSVEAAARCLENRDRERLEALISNIVRSKIEDGQLDECPLTFKDVRAVSDAFLHVLSAMMHGRIDYPQNPRTATGRPMEVVRGDLRPQPTALSLPTFPVVPPDAAPLLDADSTPRSQEIVPESSVHPEAVADFGAVGPPLSDATERVLPTGEIIYAADPEAGAVAPSAHRPVGKNGGASAGGRRSRARRS